MPASLRQFVYGALPALTLLSLSELAHATEPNATSELPPNATAPTTTGELPRSATEPNAALPPNPPPLTWRAPRFSTADYVVTLAGGAVTLATAIIHPRAQHSLSGPIGFDSDVRNALRADTLSTRTAFRRVSDVGVGIALSVPLGVDSLATAWWYRRSPEAAREMFEIDLEALAIAGALQGTTNVLVSRERPYGPDCGKTLPAGSSDCKDSFHYRSFFSGHATYSFTGAALICAHHLENQLLGGPWDALSCAGGFALAATTATFRIVADMHYASDVLMGATVGTLVGFSVPLLHYQKLGGARRQAAMEASPRPIELRLVPAPGGLGVLGIF